MQIPWWTKIGAKLLLARLPLGYAVWQRLGLFRHGSMDSSDYAIGVFFTHVDRAGLTGRLHGKRIVELGPGDSVATAVIAAAHGAQAVLVDSGAFVRVDVAPYIKLADALQRRGVMAPDLGACRDIDDVLARCNAQYLTNGLDGLRTIEAASVDLIFSHAVLEHVRRRDFAATMHECRRILRSDGVASHRIDFRDHLDGRLNNLRFSARAWESELFTRSGFYTNRIQHGAMLGMFRDAGFSIEVLDVRRWERLPTPRKRMAAEFRDLPDAELRVFGCDVLLRHAHE